MDEKPNSVLFVKKVVVVKLSVSERLVPNEFLMGG